MPDEATDVPVVDVETRIEERLFPEDPTPAEDKPELKAVPDDSEPVAEIDSNEVSEIPDGDDSEDDEVVVDEKKPQKKQLEEIDPDEQLYQQLGVLEDQVGYDEETGEIFFNAKVGDNEYQVPLKELVKSYQLEKHVNSKSIALSEKQKEFDETFGAFQSQYSEKLEQADHISKLMEKELIGSFNEVNWDQLKASDPVQYAVQRQQYSENAQRIKSIQDSLESERGEQATRQEQVMGRQIEAFKADQAEKLLQAIPQWLNPDVLERDLLSARSFAQEEYGFSDQELDGIFDSRIVRMLIDAQSFKSAKKNVETKSKKDVPKFQRSRTGKPSISKQSKAAKAKRAALRKSGSQADLTNVLVDRF